METMIKISLVLASASFGGLVALVYFVYKLYKDAYRVITVHFLAIDNVKDEFELIKRKHQEIVERIKKIEEEIEHELLTNELFADEYEYQEWLAKESEKDKEEK